jgi:acetolactate synthase-1/2/3 large subunit
MSEMNGAQALIRTLVKCGVDTCFANPGTSEMHFVAALDDVPEMHGILALFEGVATGAADGYARMADKPAATLLHLGPGLGNGLANLHNARKAHTPIVNIVGDHATYHAQFDALLQSDIATVARNVSTWVETVERPEDTGTAAASAVVTAAGAPGQVATLILPADVCWLEGGVVAAPQSPTARSIVDSAVIEGIAKRLLSGEQSMLLLGGSALRAEGLAAAGRIVAATGAELLAETFPARVERGAGIQPIAKLAYFAEAATEQLTGMRNLVLVDAKSPVSFFAYPGKASDLVPSGCEVKTLAGGGDDAIAALEAVAVAVDAPAVSPTLAAAFRPERPTGPLTADTIAQTLGALLPENAIVSEEAATSGFGLGHHTAGAPPHDWLSLTGGAIGQGMPVATGAAVACPDRKVICLQADGGAMYTIQALWTQAREGLDVTTVIFNNRSYAILNIELNRVGAKTGGTKAKEMLDLSRPDMDFVSIAQGLGVPATRATTTEEFTTQFERALATPGPALVEAMIPGIG